MDGAVDVLRVASSDALLRQHLGLRLRASRAEARAAASALHPGARPAIPPAIAFESATLLKLIHCIACVLEAADRLQIDQLPSTLEDAHRLIGLADHLAGFSVVSAFERWRSVVDPRRPVPPTDVPDLRVLREQFPATVNAMVVACPIDEIESVLRREAGAEDAHAARHTYESLRAYVLRCAPGRNERAHVAARAYAEGRLALGEMAAVLGWSVPDVVVFLDAHRYDRPSSVIALDDAGRVAILESVAADIERRAGQPSQSSALVAREVIATQRIEDVDARPWADLGDR